jgi:hypothetical protein
VAQAVEYLPSKHEALSSNPTTTKKIKNKNFLKKQYKGEGMCEKVGLRGYVA